MIQLQSFSYFLCGVLTVHCFFDYWTFYQWLQTIYAYFDLKWLFKYAMYIDIPIKLIINHNFYHKVQKFHISYIYTTGIANLSQYLLWEKDMNCVPRNYNNNDKYAVYITSITCIQCWFIDPQAIPKSVGQDTILVIDDWCSSWTCPQVIVIVPHRC